MTESVIIHKHAGKGKFALGQCLGRYAPCLAGFFVLFGIVLLVGDSTRDFWEPETPKGLVGPESLDLGFVSGKTVSGKVQLRNRNFSELEIVSIDAGCSCTIATIDQKKLDPSSVANLEFTINRRQREGKVSLPVTVYYLNPNVYGIRHLQLVVEVNWTNAIQ